MKGANKSGTDCKENKSVAQVQHLNDKRFYR